MDNCTWQPCAWLRTHGSRNPAHRDPHQHANTGAIAPAEAERGAAVTARAGLRRGCKVNWGLLLLLSSGSHYQGVLECCTEKSHRRDRVKRRCFWPGAAGPLSTSFTAGKSC